MRDGLGDIGEGDDKPAFGLRVETATARRERLQSEGWGRVDLLLPPDTIAALDRLAALHGSRTAAMIEALKNV